MVLIIHSVARTLAVNSKTVKLARKADGKIADVDHFLNLAQTLLIAFSHFIGNKFSKWFFQSSQFVPKLSYNFPTLWCRFQSPCFKSFGSRLHYLLVIFLGSGIDLSN